MSSPISKRLDPLEEVPKKTKKKDASQKESKEQRQLRHRKENMQRYTRKAAVKKKVFTPKHVITVDTSKAKYNQDIVRLCVKELGWKEYPYGKKDGSCDIYWHCNGFNDTDVISGRVNKFPGMDELSKKIELTRAMETMQFLFPDDYTFYPRTWLLPQQLTEFAAEVNLKRRRHPKLKTTYIVKPDGGSQGDGIYLIRDPNDYMLTHKSHVVQEYIDRPFLLEKYKFDLRIYVMLLSLEPLEIYISKEGMARFCTVPYEAPKVKNLHEAYMHLTNYSLNKHSTTYVHTENQHDGSKRTLSSVWSKLDSMGHDSDQIWKEIELVALKTVFALAPELRVEYKAEIPEEKSGPGCFQILGLDILLTEDLQPILLEVNSSPSLRTDYEKEVAPGVVEYIHSPVDLDIKKPVIMETLLLVAPKKKLQMKQRRSNRSCKKKQVDSLCVPVQDSISQSPPVTPLSCRYLQRDYTGYEEEDEEDHHSDPSSGTESDSPTPSHSYPGVHSPDEKVLYQLYPGRYSGVYDDLRVLERTADIFLKCLGVRSSLRMGPTGFRMFTRKCRLTTNGLSNAAVDIMFIELHRKWEFLNPDRTTEAKKLAQLDFRPRECLCFQGFLEAVFTIAKRKFRGLSRLDGVAALIDYCEANLNFGRHARPTYLPKVMMAEAEDRLQQMSISKPSKYTRLTQSDHFIEFIRQRNKKKAEQEDNLKSDG
ncbi:tubulin polyglutamylase TTLL11 isoform X3 [Lingula anatina]|uniref:Tubulin polyglutamylase TTLL11 isoform X2 n=1 Tax=Lingula anatina TaxID=7574 RepID=A0A1S3J8K2_LINAN|nr:tubulin polyglutamylase TTLL11 isoform X2 [Lingula anatina]XP_013406639.1 tubulin polyglutamylase TTLL11 isoform X3 [Lingula anatina]|eukprot:XP_013406638.1 tubulin polyglutamylase TTLL11 isoform X2 [Lingula anatina]